MSTFSVILAVDNLWGLARGGTIPWRLPGDLKRFKEITTGDGSGACIMGRKTYESIPEKYRPLPGRLNVVLTREPREFPGAVVAQSLAQGFARARDVARDIFVIGGADVYAQCFFAEEPLDVCSRVYLTRVEGDFNCDQKVPWLQKILEESYIKIHETNPRSTTTPGYSFEVYERKSN